MQSVLHPRNSPSRSPLESAAFSSKSSRIFRLTCVIRAASKYDFEDISTMALYWTCMIGVSYFISEYLFNRCLLGTATILSERDVEKAREVVRNEPVHFSQRRSHPWHIDTFEFSARKLSPASIRAKRLAATHYHPRF
jgi:hypothetical protein